MIVLPVDAARPAPEAIRRAADVIRGGGLVAFPTETVYGVGANALDRDAVARIFAAKGRPSYNPLIAHVAGLAEARALSRDWPALAERAGAAFWPGPLTLVVPRGDGVPDLLTAGLPTVAVRVPAHPVARALLEACGVPIAAPSANRFTELSPTTAGHVASGLGGRIDMLLDAGPTEVGIESTVLDLSGAEPVLLRPGSISRGALERVVGPVGDAEAIRGDSPRPSPGMTDRHYAPRAVLRIVEPESRATVEDLIRATRARGERVGALLLRPWRIDLDLGIAMPRDPTAYARRLYAALHDLDAAGCSLVLVDRVPDDPEWAGIRDRLARASHGG